MKNLLLTLFLTTVSFCFGQKILYSDQATLLGKNLNPAKIYDGETEITIKETEISVFTEGLKAFNKYIILSSIRPEKENIPLVMKAIDPKDNEVILLLDDEVLLIIYNFELEEEDQFGFKYDLRK